MSREAMTKALEALENSVDLVREDAYQAEKLYGNYPTRQGKVNGLKVLADDHEKAITALREALADHTEQHLDMVAEQALDKMAENARELGLDYEPDGMHHNKPQKRPQNCGTGYCSCIECVMEPTVPDALTASDGESAEYTAGWNDCRQLMLEMRKP